MNALVECAKTMSQILSQITENGYTHFRRFDGLGKSSSVHPAADDDWRISISNIHLKTFFQPLWNVLNWKKSSYNIKEVPEFKFLSIGNHFQSFFIYSFEWKPFFYPVQSIFFIFHLFLLLEDIIFHFSTVLASGKHFSFK